MQKIFITVSRAVFLMMVVSVLAVLVGFEVSILNSGRVKIKALDEPNLVGGEVALAAGANRIDEKGNIVEVKVGTDDARPLIIKKYLEKYKSPLLPYSDLIFRLSQTYGFEYYWIVAIAQQESNLCKKIPDNSYNCWGYGINSAGTLRFESYELALKSYAEYLKREYFDKGRNTPTTIMQKYCPHSNGSWAFGVQHFIDEMQTGSF